MLSPVLYAFPWPDARALVHGQKVLENAKGNVIGAVFNDVPRQHGRYYGYGYYHRRYGEAEEKAEGSS